jgi:hypothetical protein
MAHPTVCVAVKACAYLCLQQPSEIRYSAIGTSKAERGFLKCHEAPPLDLATFNHPPIFFPTCFPISSYTCSWLIASILRRQLSCTVTTLKPLNTKSDTDSCARRHLTPPSQSAGKLTSAVGVMPLLLAKDKKEPIKRRQSVPPAVPTMSTSFALRKASSSA